MSLSKEHRSQFSEYLAGTLSDKEAAALAAELDASPESRREFEAFRKTVELVGELETVAMPETVRQQVRQRLREARAQTGGRSSQTSAMYHNILHQVQPRSTYIGKTWAWIAGTAAAAAVAMLLWTRMPHHNAGWDETPTVPVHIAKAMPPVGRAVPPTAPAAESAATSRSAPATEAATPPSPTETGETPAATQAPIPAEATHAATPEPSAPAERERSRPALDAMVASANSAAPSAPSPLAEQVAVAAANKAAGGEAGLATQDVTAGTPAGGPPVAGSALQPPAALGVGGGGMGGGGFAAKTEPVVPKGEQEGASSRAEAMSVGQTVATGGPMTDNAAPQPRATRATPAQEESVPAIGHGTGTPRAVHANPTVPAESPLEAPAAVGATHVDILGAKTIRVNTTVRFTVVLKPAVTMPGTVVKVMGSPGMTIAGTGLRSRALWRGALRPNQVVRLPLTVSVGKPGTYPLTVSVAGANGVGRGRARIVLTAVAHE